MRKQVRPYWKWFSHTGDLFQQKVILVHIFSPHRKLNRNLWPSAFLSWDKENRIKTATGDLHIKQDMVGSCEIAECWILLAFLPSGLLWTCAPSLTGSPTPPYKREGTLGSRFLLIHYLFWRFDKAKENDTEERGITLRWPRLISNRSWRMLGRDKGS